MIKLAGIVTLYHPDKEVKKNIESYLSNVDKLYVVDNTPNKENKDILPKSNKIEYIFNNKNIGVSKALNVGAKKAIKDKFDYLLTMDQDSRFKKNDIEKMIEFIENYQQKDLGLVTPWHVINTNPKKPKTKIDYPLEVMTSGNIISLKAFKKIGGYKDELFIDGIDFDYCMNLNIHGFKVIRLNYVHLKHDLGNIEIKHHLRRDFVCSNHNYIRRYYIVRNTLYICKWYEEYFKEYTDFLKRGLRGQLMNVVLFEKDKFRKVRNMYRGYRDYKKGVLGEYSYKN